MEIKWHFVGDAPTNGICGLMEHARFGLEGWGDGAERDKYKTLINSEKLDS